MVVMAIITLFHEFEPRGSITEIKPLHHPQLLQQLHRPVNRGEVAFTRRQFGEDFLVRQRMRVMPQHVQNGRARAGNLMRFPTQAASERRKLRLGFRMFMRAAVFHDSKITLATPNASPTPAASIFPTGNL